MDIISWIYSVSECLQENCIKDLFCTETCFCLLFIQEGTFFKKKKILSHRSIKTTKTVYDILLELNAWEKDIKTFEKFMNRICFLLLDIWRHFKTKSQKHNPAYWSNFAKAFFFQHTKILRTLKKSYYWVIQISFMHQIVLRAPTLHKSPKETQVCCSLGFCWDILHWQRFMSRSCNNHRDGY